MTTLTFIGNGNMAKALIQGLKDSYKIEVIGRNKKTLEALKEQIPTISTKILTKNENIEGKNIILCVKPNSIDDLSQNLTGIADELYSVLAGTTIETLKDKIPAKLYIRTMPNLAAQYLKSMTTITGDIELKAKALDIFNNIGSTLWVNSQKELDIATCVAGSGPAYLALIAESLSDGAVQAGLKRTDANILVSGLFDGFAKLLNSTHPATIKDNTMSPGGTTAAGYAAMEQSGVRNGMIKAVQNAYEKACQLGK